MFGGGLPHDSMHDILEGIASLEIKLFLRLCTMSGIFSLSYLNDRLMNFNFGYSEQDKPVPILSAVYFVVIKKNTVIRFPNVGTY